MQKIIQLELNEVNFEFLEAYCARGELPVLAGLIDRHGVTETTSETEYNFLEPWIQWVSAHTGKAFGEHQVFRLGDILDRADVQQIWEILERDGHSVAAMSPMNARNACRQPAFFVPDPWVGGEVVGSPILRRLYTAISRLVNDNAEGRLNLHAVGSLLVGMAWYTRLRNVFAFAGLALKSMRQSWARALVLDALLADVFITECRRNQPHYATLFLNAAAHLQHHHLFDSAVYSGPHRNPTWYSDQKADPIFAVYAMYDRIVGQVCSAFPDHRLIIATGLHQTPYPELKFYWRIRDHATFLRDVGVDYLEVLPRMSRDFLVRFETPQAAAEAERRLATALASDGERLFEIDNRGDSLFVMLRYPHDIAADVQFKVDGVHKGNLRERCAFVAIKNGEHDGTGYLIDTAESAGGQRGRIPLTEIFSRTLDHFGARAMA